MKLIAVLLLTVLPNFTLAIDNNRHAPATGNQIFTNQTKITWEEFKSGIPEICRGIKSTGHYIQKDACVFWSKNKDKTWNCLVFTKEGINDEAFGKIIKRCYQEN